MAEVKYVIYDVDTQKKYGEIEDINIALAFIEALFNNMITVNLQIQQVVEEV
jgi:hypothetical protein